MAIYHLSVTQIKRSQGHSAVAAAAYRAGEKLYDARLDQWQDYSRKQGVVQSQILTPDNAPDWMKNRGELWNGAEAMERQHNGQPAREIRLALPDELTDEQRADLVFRYVNDTFVSCGMIADVSIHRPDRYGDERNHHAHILLTMRELDGDTFAKTKQRDWNKSELVEDWREKWAEYQNDALADAGFDARVDHRTLEAQGIDRDPTRHMGKEASAMERDGIATRIGDENRAAFLQDAEFDRLRGELAEIQEEIAWEQVSTLEEPGRKGLRYVEWYAMQAEKAKTAFSPSAQHDDLQSWEVMQVEAQSNFDGDITHDFVRDIVEYGRIVESGLGRSWYDRTLTMFENLYHDAVDLYYDTIEQAHNFWQRATGYDGREPSNEPEPGRDEPEMEIW